MKILLIHQYFKDEDVTGGARFNEMTRVWRRLGHETTVIAGNYHAAGKMKRYQGRFATKTEVTGTVVWRCYVSEKYNSGFFGRLWAYLSFVFSGTYVGLFKIRGKFDVILVTSPPLFVGITAYILKLFKKIPIVFEVRDLWPESAIDTGVLRNGIIIKFAYWFEKFIYKKARVISVLTPAFYNVLVEDKKVPCNKVITIPNAADFNISDAILKTANREHTRNKMHWNGKFVVIYVGAHGVANGLHQILQAADRLRDTNVLFALVGSGGREKEKLMKTAINMKLDNVRFYDPVPKNKVFEYIVASDVGVAVLMRNDTFKTVYSNKTFDYMSCKKPILMAIDGISKKLVEDANAGIYVEPENPVDFEKKVRFYLSNPDQAKAHGENGYAYAKKKFDRESLAVKYVESIRKYL